ncbi:MAG: amino acid/amide transporter ATP-binding protein 2, family [Planctomycetota bacterium]|nr:amino acid/amide transporter ATP-binding protein 2, family [Planctomycetota bacterium]
MTHPANPRSLMIRSLRVAYGPIVAIHGLDLDLADGEIVALIGANGAGKTSIMRALSGLATASGSAVVSFDGQSHELIGMPPRLVPSLGVAHVPEGRGVFLNLSVRENLLMGAMLRRDRAVIHADLERRLEQFPRLRERLGRPAMTLSGGEQQMLAIARALMGRPRFLLMDEPSLGLAPKLVAEVFASIQGLAAEGMSILLVEQNARMALKVAQRGYVLEGGRVVLSGPAATLAQDERVRDAYLGGVGRRTA